MFICPGVADSRDLSAWPGDARRFPTENGEKRPMCLHIPASGSICDTVGCRTLPSLSKSPFHRAPAPRESRRLEHAHPTRMNRDRLPCTYRWSNRLDLLRACPLSAVVQARRHGQPAGRAQGRLYRPKLASSRGGRCDALPFLSCVVGHQRPTRKSGGRFRGGAPGPLVPASPSAYLRRAVRVDAAMPMSSEERNEPWKAETWPTVLRLPEGNMTWKHEWGAVSAVWIL
jgi:hypothetical protein